jgi:tRNA G37 N-methylase Trm5
MEKIKPQVNTDLNKTVVDLFAGYGVSAVFYFLSIE